MLVCDNNEGSTLQPLLPAPTILVVMRDPQVASAIRQSVEFANPAVHMITAESGSEAHAILQREAVSLAITILPVKTGFEFVAIASERYPQMPHIVASCSQAGEIDDVALRLMDLLERHDEQLLVDRLALSLIEALILQRASSGFLRGVPLLDTIRLLEADACTSTLSLRQSKSNSQAVLFFRNGRLLDAHTGNCGGLEAAREVLAWGDVHISVSSGCCEMEARIDKPVFRLMEEWLSQAADTAAYPQPAPPEPSQPVVEPDPPVAPPRQIVHQPTMREILASQELEYDLDPDWQSPPSAPALEPKPTMPYQPAHSRLLETVDYDPAGLDQLTAPAVEHTAPTPFAASAPPDRLSLPDLIDAGFASFRSKNYAAAIAQWEQASKLDPGNRTLHYNVKQAQAKLTAQDKPFATRAASQG